MKLWTSVLFRSITVCLILFYLTGCGVDKEVTVIKLAHALDVTHPVHKGMVFMAKKVDEFSKGKMRVDIYPSGQLGAERELIDCEGCVIMTPAQEVSMPLINRSIHQLI
ncbi:MAG: hypothetical protein P8Y99_04295 [Calditrichaceae bacterium]